MSNVADNKTGNVTTAHDDSTHRPLNEEMAPPGNDYLCNSRHALQRPSHVIRVSDIHWRYQCFVVRWGYGSDIHGIQATSHATNVRCVAFCEWHLFFLWVTSTTFPQDQFTRTKMPLQRQTPSNGLHGTIQRPDRGCSGEGVARQVVEVNHKRNRRHSPNAKMRLQRQTPSNGMACMAHNPETRPSLMSHFQFITQSLVLEFISLPDYSIDQCFRDWPMHSGNER